jgi:hypothetical protein
VLRARTSDREHLGIRPASDTSSFRLRVVVDEREMIRG